MGKLTRGQTALLTTVAGACILAAGFLAGRAIGNDGDPAPAGSGQVPTRIATQRASVEVPTLGEAKQIPTLEVPNPPAEATSEESTAPGSSGELESPAPESESPAPTPAPEVTVAPNG